MITIDEIKNITFRKANIGGYKTEDVEVFINSVVELVEKKQEEKTDLIKKLEILAKRIEMYRTDEENVRGALINAQKIMDEAIKDANENAQKIIDEAKAQADQIMEDAHNKAANVVVDAEKRIVNQQTYCLKLIDDASGLREKMLQIYSSHMSMLEQLPTEDDILKLKNKFNEEYTPQEETNEEFQAESDYVDVSQVSLGEERKDVTFSEVKDDEKNEQTAETLLKDELENIEEISANIVDDAMKAEEEIVEEIEEDPTIKIADDLIMQDFSDETKKEEPKNSMFKKKRRRR